MSALTIPGWEFLNHVTANAGQVRKRRKSCILLWMSGGPPSIDMWDLKPHSRNGGEFQPISTSGDLQITEHLPRTAQLMKHLSVVRTMSTREADHGRGRYYVHTGFVPNPAIIHPTFGSVVSLELGSRPPELEIPAFVSIGGSTEGPGFVGMNHAAFQVDSTGEIPNAELGAGLGEARLTQRRMMLDAIETEFISTNRGRLAKDHQDTYRKAMQLTTSRQMQAFRVEEERPETVEMYTGSGVWGRNPFGMGCLMAHRLVETGVPFVEVVAPPGSWDLHARGFEVLRDAYLPVLDLAISALTTDLAQRGLLQDTVIVCMGEFGRTPRINQNAGRDHWANTWSVLIGGGGIRSGIAVGETDNDGTECLTQGYLPGDIWATVSRALGIPLETVHRPKNGRPVRLANGGTPIKELFG